jgi:hypothetical protein
MQERLPKFSALTPGARTLVVAAAAAFVVIFNLGYVFHELLLHEWFQGQLRGVAREHYIVPLVAVAFAAYVLIVSYLFPMYRRAHPSWSALRAGTTLGLLMGLLWDGLQGGLIEYATMRVSFVSFVVDSSYHTLEGGLAGAVIAWVYERAERRRG